MIGLLFYLYYSFFRCKQTMLFEPSIKKEPVEVSQPGILCRIPIGKEIEDRSNGKENMSIIQQSSTQVHVYRIWSKNELNCLFIHFFFHRVRQQRWQNRGWLRFLQMHSLSPPLEKRIKGSSFRQVNHRKCNRSW